MAIKEMAWSCAATIAAAWFLLLAPAATGGVPIDVYVLSGQSNMVGSGWVNGAIAQGDGDLMLQEDVLYHFNITQAPPVPPDVVASGWGPLREITAEGHSYGLELSFGQTMAEASENQVAIIKTCVNGAAIRFFLPGWTYWNRIDPYIADAVSDLESMGYDPTIKAFVWVQGSSDANSLTNHAIYGQRLEELTDAMRGLWGADLTIVQSQQFCCGPYPQNQIDAVRAAKEDFVANDANATLTLTDDVDMRADAIHYSWQGFIDLGERLADALLAHEPADINGDGAIDTKDLGMLIASYGETGRVRADLNGDRVVDTADLGMLIAAFGSI